MPIASASRPASPEVSPVGRLRLSCLSMTFLFLTAMAGYELAAHSRGLPGGPLPGHLLAEQVDASVPVHAWSGLRPLDRLLHECEEAACYYWLATHGPRVHSWHASTSARRAR
jgi:hypothetical protein